VREASPLEREAGKIMQNDPISGASGKWADRVESTMIEI